MSYYTASDGSTYYAHKERLNDFAKYCQNNRISKVKKYVEIKMINNFDLHKGIMLASRYGHIKVIKYLLPILSQDGYTINEPVYKKNIINYAITIAFLWYHMSIINYIVNMRRCGKKYHINAVDIGTDLNNRTYEYWELNSRYLWKAKKDRYVYIFNLGYVNKNGRYDTYRKVNNMILL